jgi:uncharacterized protein YpmB
MIKARKKPRIILIIILFIIFVFSLVNFVRLNPRIFTSKKYVFSEKACAMVFSSTPKDLAKTKGSNLHWTDDFCVSATVDKNDNLVIVMTKEQVQNFRDFASTYISEALMYEEIEISSDYKKVTVTTTNERMFECSFMANLAVSSCSIVQFCDGTSPEKIDVLLTYINADSGEVIHKRYFSESLGKTYHFSDGKISKTGDGSVS